MIENSETIPWRRLFAEGIAIVASILIAFAIDAWWAARVDREEELELLTVLQAELQNNTVSFDDSLRFRHAILGATTQLLEYSAQYDSVSSEELDRLVGALVWWDNTPPAVGVAQTIVQGGRLALVKRKTLRIQIASLSTVYQELQQINHQHYETFKLTLMPYLITHAGIPQLSNAQPVSPGTGDQPQPPLPVGERIDLGPLLADQEFVGIVTNLT